MSVHKSSALPAPVIVKRETPVSVESILAKEDELWRELKDDMKILTHTSYQGFMVTNPMRRVAGGRRLQQNKKYLKKKIIRMGLYFIENNAGRDLLSQSWRN